MNNKKVIRIDTAAMTLTNFCDRCCSSGTGFMLEKRVGRKNGTNSFSIQKADEGNRADHDNRKM